MLGHRRDLSKACFFDILSSVDHAAQNRFIADELDILFDVGRCSGILGKSREIADAADGFEFVLPLEFFADEVDIGGLVLR